jgi:hypothetical protein
VSSSSHFFSITAGFGSLCLYVRARLIFLFVKKISVGENLPNFQYFKIYILNPVFKVLSCHSFENCQFSKSVLTNSVLNFFLKS